MEFYDSLIFLLKILFVVIIVLSVVIGVVIPLMQSLTNRSPRRSIQSPVRGGHQRPFFSNPLDDDEIEIPTNGKDPDEEKREIIRMAKDDAAKTTMLIRNWINEKK